jgi:pentatricopeptide repeat protein
VQTASIKALQQVLEANVTWRSYLEGSVDWPPRPRQQPSGPQGKGGNDEPDFIPGRMTAVADRIAKNARTASVERWVGVNGWGLAPCIGWDTRLPRWWKKSEDDDDDDDDDDDEDDARGGGGGGGGGGGDALCVAITRIMKMIEDTGLTLRRKAFTMAIAACGKARESGKALELFHKMIERVRCVAWGPRFIRLGRGVLTACGADVTAGERAGRDSVWGLDLRVQECGRVVSRSSSADPAAGIS